MVFSEEALNSESSTKFQLPEMPTGCGVVVGVVVVGVVVVGVVVVGVVLVDVGVVGVVLVGVVVLGAVGLVGFGLVGLFTVKTACLTVTFLRACLLCFRAVVT